MTIYIVNWTEHNNVSKKSYATGNYLDAKLKYKDVLTVANRDSSVSIQERDQAISKVQIKTQKEVIDLINKL